MGCIVSNVFLDFYIFFIFTRPLRVLLDSAALNVQFRIHNKIHFILIMCVFSHFTPRM